VDGVFYRTSPSTLPETNFNVVKIIFYVNGALVSWGFWELQKFLLDVMGHNNAIFLFNRKIDEHALCGCSEYIAEREWLDELA